MRMRRLGAHGPEISVIGYGAWEAGGEWWGPNPSDDEVVGAIRSGLDAGINWIDTAEIYGSGESERLVGLAVAGRRDEVLVATKVAPRSSGSGFVPEQVRRACEGSLARMGLDHVDLFQLHWPDLRVPVEETWGAMAALVDEGKARFIGVSNFDRALIERCLAIRHVDALQPHFSMLHHGHRDLIRWCGERGIGVVSYGPLAYGLLTGAFRSREDFAKDDWRRRGGADYYDALFAPGKLERSLAVVERLRPIAERLGCTMAQLALAWNVAQEGVTAAIAGSRNPMHVRDNAEASDLELDAETLAELEALLPLGPG